MVVEDVTELWFARSDDVVISEETERLEASQKKPEPKIEENTPNDLLEITQITVICDGVEH